MPECLERNHSTISPCNIVAQPEIYEYEKFMLCSPKALNSSSPRKISENFAIQYLYIFVVLNLIETNEFTSQYP